MFRIAVIVVVLALARADFECCSQEDREEVQVMWQTVWGAANTGRRIIIAQAVFQDLFEREPDAKKVFEGVNVDDLDSPTFKAHCLRIVNGLDTLIGLLDDTKTLELQLDHLGTQHTARAELGVKAEYFALIGRSYAKVLPQVSGCFNLDAWNRCFSGIANKLASYMPA